MKFDEQWVNSVYTLFDTFYNDTREYKDKCRSNENFWQAQHWKGIKKQETGEPQPVTPVIFSTLENMLADIMDNYPSPIILGEERGDENIAERLGRYIEYILKRRGYKRVYRDKCREMLKKGMSIQEIYWDTSLYGGLGDVNIKNVDIDSFLWDDSVRNIQLGRACFKYYFYPKQWFEDRYPKEAPKFKTEAYVREGKRGLHDEEYMLIEYWYKTYDKTLGRECVHMARLAGHTLLEASEREFPKGIYAHGRYPFIVERLYPIGGKITGLSIIDIFKNLQIYADKLDQIIVKNALMSGKVKLLVNRNADVDEAALCDWNTEVVRGERIDDSSVRWFQPSPLNPAVMAHYNNKLSAIKEESGQNMFSRGESGNGITAASAIMALQEAGSKRSRLIIDDLYDGFEELVRMVIDVICENYTESRMFRLDGKDDYLSGNMLLKEQYGGGVRAIDFDVSVHVQKQTPYRTLYQNELALELLRNGILQPIEALEMMEFEGRERAMEWVRARTEQMESKLEDNVER